MIRRRVWTLAIAAIATSTVFLGASECAEAGVRLKIESGSETLWYYSTDDTFLSTGAFSIGAYTGNNIETTSTNWPGTPAIGGMSQTINIQTVGSSAADLIVQSWVVDDSTLGGLTAGLISDAGDIALLAAAAEKAFTLPETIDFYAVTSDVASAVNSSVTSGTVVTTTTVDGVDLDSLVRSLAGPNGSVLTSVLVPDVAPTNQYTLNQTVVMSGVNLGATTFNFTGSSGVTAVPEPSTVAMALTSMGLLGLGAVRHRRKKA